LTSSRGKDGTCSKVEKWRKDRLERTDEISAVGAQMLDVYIYLWNCLKVVWKLSVSEYILTYKTKGTALVRKGCSHTLNPTNPKYFCWNIFLARCFGLNSSFFWSCVSSTNKIFSRTNNLTIQTRTTILQNKYSYLNAVKRSINASSTPLIILINESRLRLHS